MPPLNEPNSQDQSHATLVRMRNATISASIQMPDNESHERSKGLGRRDVAERDLSAEDQPSLRQLLEEDLNLALHAAIKGGELEVVRDLLRSGADPMAS